jgi:hypothetical protein
MNRLTFLALGTLLASAASAQQRVEVKTVAPRPEDVSSIDGMIKAWYEVISGPAGQPRDWARDRTLYIADVRFVQVDRDERGHPQPRILDHQQYVDRADPAMRKGFFEKEIHRATRRFGPIAHVWSTYETRRTPDGPVVARGINSIELFWDGTRWWIANAIWSDEADASPIPPEFLPARK